MKPRFTLLGLIGTVTLVALLAVAVTQSQRAYKAESKLLRLSKTTPIPQEPADQPMGKPHPFGVRAIPTSIDLDHERLTYIESGLTVERVDPDTLAYHSGIFAGDTIVSMAGWKIESLANLDYVYDYVQKHPDKSHAILAIRDGQLISGNCVCRD